MLERSRTLSFLHQKNVKLVKVRVQNQVIMLAHVQCVEDMVKLDLAKDFLQFNKHVHNVLDRVKRLQTLATIAMVKENNKQPKDFQFQFQKVLMMEQEYDFQVKERLALEVQEMVTFTFL